MLRGAIGRLIFVGEGIIAPLSFRFRRANVQLLPQHTNISCAADGCPKCP